MLLSEVISGSDLLHCELAEGGAGCDGYNQMCMAGSILLVGNLSRTGL